MALEVVVALVDARHAGDAQTTEIHHTRIAEVVDVAGGPASVGELLKMIRGLKMK